LTFVTLAVWKRRVGYDSAGKSAEGNMGRFVEGADRGQATLLPEYLDDWVEQDNPVRAIDAFVDALDLAE